MSSWDPVLDTVWEQNRKQVKARAPTHAWEQMWDYTAHRAGWLWEVWGPGKSDSMTRIQDTIRIQR